MGIHERDYRKKNNARFGGKRDIVLERDGHKCVDCGMTQEEHLARFHKSLTINHIDGQGRNSTEPNNDLGNLETLCLPCHGKKDGPRWMIGARDAHPLELLPTI